MITQVALDLPTVETLDYSYNPASKNNSTKPPIIGHWVIVKVKNKKNLGLVSISYSVVAILSEKLDTWVARRQGVEETEVGAIRYLQNKN